MGFPLPFLHLPLADDLMNNTDAQDTPQDQVYTEKTSNDTHTLQAAPLVSSLVRTYMDIGAHEAGNTWPHEREVGNTAVEKDHNVHRVGEDDTDVHAHGHTLVGGHPFSAIPRVPPRPIALDSF